MSSCIIIFHSFDRAVLFDNDLMTVSACSKSLKKKSCKAAIENINEDLFNGLSLSPIISGNLRRFF
jgi:hypothetical protein